ncbi:MAG: AAA family ATPase [Planctomycetota bacterium]
MITTLDIKGFKSVKDIHLDCKRINIFIGEPNTGKSNILEALGFLSWCARGGSLKDYVRVDSARDLFYDGMMEKDGWRINLKLESKDAPLFIKAEISGNTHAFYGSDKTPFLYLLQAESVPMNAQKQFEFIRFYRFKTLTKFPDEAVGYLKTPDGSNLVSLLYSSKALRQLAADYFQNSGMTFVVKPHEKQIELLKQSEGVAVSVPYHLSSDTLHWYY